MQGPLQPLFDQLTAWPRETHAANWGKSPRKRIIASREDVPVFMGWQVWDKDWEEHTDVYERMAKRFPHVLTADKMWNTAMMLYEPDSIPNDTIEQLRMLQGEFCICNDPELGGTDQQIIDLLLHDHIAQVAEKGWCWHGLDEENARVPSIARGWRGDEVPAILHYGRWYAPWIEKTEDMDAYNAPRLGRVCHEFYTENLAKFDEMFPIT